MSLAHTNISLSETSRAVTFYRNPFEPCRNESRDIMLFTLSSSLLSNVQTISPGKGNSCSNGEERAGEKKKEKRGSFVSRIARAVDLHVAGSDKSTTAEAATTSRKIEERRERWNNQMRVSAEIKRAGKRVVRLYAICPDPRAFSSVGFVSQDLSRELLGIAFASAYLTFLSAARGESFPCETTTHRIASRSRANPRRACELSRATVKLISSVSAKIWLYAILLFFDIKYFRSGI